MSTTMDLSPLKLETSSVHSTSRLAPIRPSTTISPNDSNLNMEPTYSKISFEVFSGSRTRSNCRSFTVGLEHLEFESTTKLSTAPNYPPICSEKLKSTSPMTAGCVTNKDQDNCHNDVNAYEHATSSSPLYFLEESINHQMEKFHQQHDADDEWSVIPTGFIPEFQSGSKSIQHSKKLSHNSRLCADDAGNETFFNSSMLSEKKHLEYYSQDIGTIGDFDITENDKETTDDNNMDNIKCTNNCERTCSNTLYSCKDNCCSSTESQQSQPSEARFKKTGVKKRCICDAITFPGKILLNKSGSVYVLEDALTDGILNGTFNLYPESIVSTEDQSRAISLPQVSNVTFFPKRNSSMLTQKATVSLEFCKSSPAFVSYLVFDLECPVTRGLLKLKLPSDTYDQSQQPILICLICKLIFLKRDSFLQHSVCCHDVILSEDEKLLFFKYNTSVITHASENNNLAKLLLLYPVNDICSFNLDDSEFASLLKRKLAEYTEHKTALFSEESASVCNDKDDQITSKDMVLMASRAKSSTNDLNSGLTLEMNISTNESPCELYPLKYKLSMENSLSDSPSPSSASDEAPVKTMFQTTAAVFNETSAALRLRMTEPITSSTSLYSSTTSHSLIKSASVTSNLSVLPMPSLVLSSINSTTVNPHSNLPSGTSLFFQSNNGQMPNFLHACDAHPQGRHQGLECSQCDLTMNPSLSSSAHIAMTHSRNSCKTLKCPKCNWHYKYHETLEIHMKEKHPDNESQCVYCISSQIHPRLARGESYSCGYKPYKCEVCNYSTTTKGNLSIHMQSDKHINNIQDFTTGNTEPKQRLQQPSPNQPSPMTNPFSKNTSSFSQNDHQFPRDDLQFFREKHKQSFRCGICSYETSVARNLRIHMTSEKHTQKALEMTQSINRLQQDFALQRAKKINKLLAASEHTQETEMVKISNSIPNPLFFMEENITTVPVSAGVHQHFLEDNAMLSKENIPDECDNLASNQDAVKMFQCCICSRYASDSIENVLNHIKLDRTKFGRAESHTSFNNGTYFCSLCSYKTNLKANFHLHCKTDKHLQKLQMVIHIMEGGPENEGKLSQSISSVQMCCNACNFHANSTQKIQFHLASVQHGACAKLFRHLQLLEHASIASGPSNTHCYHCSICDISVTTKQNLVAHSITPQHIQRAQSIHQSHVAIFHVYALKDTSDSETRNSLNGDDDNGTVHSDKSGSVSSTLMSGKNSARFNNQIMTTSSSSGDLGSSTTSALTTLSPCASSRCIVSSNAATNSSVLKQESEKEEFYKYSNSSSAINLEVTGQLRALSGAPKLPGPPSGSQISATSTPSSFKESPKYSINGNENTGNNCDRANDCLNNPHSTAAQFESLSEAEPTHSKCILCPLCRHECTQENLLTEHLVKKHNVVQEGIEKILSMVEATSSTCSLIPSSNGCSSALPTSWCNGSKNNTNTVSSLPVVLSSSTTIPVTQKEKVLDPSSADNSNSKFDDIPDTKTHKISSALRVNITSDHTSSTSSSSITATSSTSLPTESIGSPAVVVTNNHAPSSSFSNHCLAPETRVNVTLSLKDREREINLERLEAENAHLLATEGIDLTLVEHLDKEFEHMFRCQTCGKSFTDIQGLFDHQNELGHLELKLTPRGPGYLCWKKGCNQYFKTASTLQVHFAEIHTKASSSGILTPQDIELYKFKCGQCFYSFKSLAAMQKHTLIHLIQSVIQCKICYKKFNSVKKMESHLTTDHSSLELSDLNLHMESIKTNAGLLFDIPGSDLFLSNFFLLNGNSKSKNGFLNSDDTFYEGKSLKNGVDTRENREEFIDRFYKNANAIDNSDKKFLEDYMDISARAEEYFKSNECKFKCRICKMGFTSQQYLFLHKKTSLHRDNEQVERFDNHDMSFKCDVCSESFPQKNIFHVHCNSASHLHKLKQQVQMSDDNRISFQAPTHFIPHAMPPYSVGNTTSSTAAYTTGHNMILDASTGNNVSIKPYRCNICKVGYTNLPTFEIHLRSVGHKTKSSRLGELIQSGQLDITQALIEHPDPRITGKQQAQIIADIIHQQVSAQAASPAAFFNLQSLQGTSAMPHELAQIQKDAFYSSINPQLNDTRKVDNFTVTNSREHLKEMQLQTSTNPGLVETTNETSLKDDNKIEDASTGSKVVAVSDNKCPQGEGKNIKKDDDLPPQFHAPVIARPRGFMGRFKPQLYKSLLENFGFEWVMLFNEENTRSNKDLDVVEERVESNDEVICQKINVEQICDMKKSDDGVKINDIEAGNDFVHGVVKKDEDYKENIQKDDTNSSTDLTEVSKRKCKTCHKDFSNVWVLKNHEEVVHDLSISPEVIEEFGRKFKEEWIKNLPRSLEQEASPLVFPNPPTPSATITTENIPTKDMPPPKPPNPPQQLQSHFDLSQLFPFMGMNLLPMHLSLNLMNLGLQNSLMPSLMLPGMDLTQSFLPHMPSPACAESPTSANAQQHFLAATSAATAYNQKRVRTRISDDQLKVLRQYFDINNSPSEEQVNKMANQTGLPQKVIKHWFRNTLFKERQRNKDSPYNFNNPPSTSIDLDEYDRTGKIPEIKLEPDDEYDRDTTPILDSKKGDQPVEDIVEDRQREQDNESFHSNSVKLDLTPKTETNEEVIKEQDWYSNSSSPFMSSIPSTPTASISPIPTSTNIVNPINTTNSLAFRLDNYAASMSRLEAATFQNLGKRANRTRFTDYQIKTLQDYFERNAYPKDDELEKLSKILGLSARVIVVWFQNARQKARKTFDNHPPNENTKESSSLFQRTPGLNYQCKKCNSVYQRYYELIKHQKHCYVGDSNNSKVVLSINEDDSNFSFSNDDSSFSECQNTPAQGYKERDFQTRPQAQEPPCVPTTSSSKIPRASSTPLAASPHLSTSSAIPTLKRDKSPITFSRFDTFQEHTRTHNNIPNMFVPYSTNSVSAHLQSLSHQEDNKITSTISATAASNSLFPSLMSNSISAFDPSFTTRTTPTSSLSLSPSSKRKTDSEDDSGEQPKDKRLRTTILPEQLDYLYQQYQIDCNPSRKQLEHIAVTVNLKKRVVQVWFQNTRARERKGHYRSHQQLINKRCPFCRALFRAKSTLESHLVTKHPEEVAKGDINIDLIPDAPLETSSQIHTSLSGHDVSHMPSTNSILDINKCMPQPTAAAMPNYMNLMSTPSGLNLPFPGPNPEMLRHVPFEDNFFKKYLNNMVNNMAMRQEHPLPQTHVHVSPPATGSAHSTPKPPTHQSPSLSQLPHPLDAHKVRATPQLPVIPSNEDAPLDLSKPIKATDTRHVDTPSHTNYPSHTDFNEPPKELSYRQRLNTMDESFSETQIEISDHEHTNDFSTNPPSPSHNINFLNHTTGTPCSIGKRYRTQMSAAQVKVMKNLFQDYKTPTMAECELLGHEIGLAKRVVQVWFQNARAKEKKAKLNCGNPYNPEADFPKTPEECKLCSYKYTHKVTVQDHIFTKAHIDRVKAFLKSQGFQDNDLCSPGFQGLPHSQNDIEHTHKMWDSSVPSRHLEQLQAMELNTAVMGYPISPDERILKGQEKEQKKERKNDELTSKEEQQHNQAALEMAMNVQMMSALGGYMPGLEPAYLPYMYNGLPGYFPGLGLPMMQPGLIPEHILAYDTLAYGTPLTLLQIPPAAIKSISEKVTESGAVLARYTQDCQALADLHNVVGAADLTVAAEATLDVGYICKKCHMVFPARDSCVAHQNSVCMAKKPPHPKEFEPIMKLEQVQYECRACRERFSTILEFKSHCQQETHKHKLMKFKAREAARHETTGSPSSSAPYASSSSNIIISSPPPSVLKPFTTSPSNNNNNNRIHNNNQVTAPDGDYSWKPVMTKSPPSLHTTSSPNATSLYSNKHLPQPTSNYFT